MRMEELNEYLDMLIDSLFEIKEKNEIIKKVLANSRWYGDKSAEEISVFLGVKEELV